jgi:glycosyltransferase involved in cell wall biosynthesis
MKVLWIIDSLGPGGAEGLMLPLLKNMSGSTITPRVCALRVRNGNPIAVELEKINVAVDLLPIENLRDVAGFKHLVEYIRRHKPDVVHTQLETSDIFGTLAAKHLGIPSVSTVHTLDIPSKKRRTYWRNFLRWHILGWFAQRVIAVSNITRDVYLKLGISSKKLVTMYNGIDLKVFTQKGSRASHKRKILNLPPGCVVITTVAVLREPKGIQFMLQALPAIVKVVPNLFYVIVGDGDYRMALEELSNQLNIQEHVIFLGHRTDIPEILAASDLFVFPTLQDALPTVLFEAMAVGLPIIASAVGGVPEIIHHQQNGVLVPPADTSSLAETCIHLLSDGEYLKQISASALRTVKEKFDIQKQIQNLTNLYDQVALTP